MSLRPTILSAAFDAKWQNASFRTRTHVLTLVWGITLTGEFLLRLILVYALSIPTFLAIGPLIFYGVIIGIVAFTHLYSQWSRRVRMRSLRPKERRPGCKCARLFTFGRHDSTTLVYSLVADIALLVPRLVHRRLSSARQDARCNSFRGSYESYASRCVLRRGR